MHAKLTQALMKNLPISSGDIVDTQLPGFKLRVRSTGAKTWVFRYRLNNGPQQRLRLGTYPAVTADQARKLALAAAADVARGIDVAAKRKGERQEQARRRANTLSVFLEDRYGPWAQTHLHTGKVQVKRIEADFPDWLEKPMHTLDVATVERWRAGRIEIGNEPVTVNRKLQRVHAVLAKAVEWKVIDRHPFAGIKPLRHDKTGRVRYLEETEEQQLRDALIAREEQLRAERDRFNEWRRVRHLRRLPRHQSEYVDHLRPIVLLALNTGLRRGELFHLKWGDVNLKTKWVVVIGKTSKTKQTRKVPLNIEAATVLEKWREQCGKSGVSDYVFPGDQGAKLTAITTAWRSLRTKANLPDFNFHDLRHHFASRLVQSGVDLNSVRELLGHADIKMVLRYAHLAPGGLAIAVEKVARIAPQPAAA